MGKYVPKWWFDMFGDDTIHLTPLFHDSTQWQTGFEQKRDELLNRRIEYLKTTDFIKNINQTVFNDFEVIS